jgi:hypothetical protein
MLKVAISGFFSLGWWVWLFATKGEMPSTIFGVKSLRVIAIWESYQQSAIHRLAKVGFNHLLAVIGASPIFRA